jgi:hypothetical protein
MSRERFKILEDTSITSEAFVTRQSPEAAMPDELEVDAAIKNLLPTTDLHRNG